ncbi:MAG: hypothetical protein IJS12_09560 [Lachnospiraceae bacterium]|nr:hypothetical protein [Lachnospiraceae bacterium]
MTDSKKRIINLISAYLITFAVFNIGGFASTDIMLGLLCVGIYAVLCRVTGITDIVPVNELWGDRVIRRTSFIISAIWTLLYIIYASDRLGGGMENRLFIAVYTVLSVAGIFVFVYVTVQYLIAHILAYATRERADTAKPAGEADDTSVEACSGAVRAPFSAGRFLIYAGIIFICLLPLFLVNFPGTMTVDSFDQLNQARGLKPYSDLHPWAHTLLIQLFWHIGYAISGSVNGGIAFYMIIQMIIVALSVAYAIESLAEAGLGLKGCIAVLFGYLIYPYNPAFAITMWKDVIFSAGVIVFLITLYRVAESRKWTVRDTVLFTISGIVVCLIRHNGFYAFIMTMAVFVLYMFLCTRRQNGGEKRGGRIIPICGMSLAIIILTCIFNGPVNNAYDVEPVDYSHNLAIPLQQVARVVSHNGTIPASDYEMLERINTTEFLRSHYEPGGADPSIQWVAFGDMAYLEEHKPEYLALWIRLGLRNPRAYFEAFIDQTRGYYTTMPPEQTEYYGILPNTDGLGNTPLIAGNKRIKINEISGKLHTVLPVYAILYSPGACLQLLMLGAALILLVSRKKKSRSGYALIAYLPVTALIFTVILATPLCADLRYAYPLMLCMPALIAITVMNLRNG